VVLNGFAARCYASAPYAVMRVRTLTGGVVGLA